MGDPVTIAVIGAGGVGSYLAGSLARLGHRVILLGRDGPHLQAIARDGLTVEEGGARFHVTGIEAVATAPERPAEVVIPCVKIYDLAAVAASMRPLVGPETLIVPVQNGVAAPDILAEAFDPAQVLGGCIYFASFARAPGLVVQGSTVSRFLFGEMAGGVSPRVERLRDLCAGTGFEAVARPDIRRDMWDKLVQLAAFSGLCCVTDASIGQVAADPLLLGLFRAAMAEVVAVARAAGVVLDDAVIERNVATLSQYRPEAKASMHADLTAGKPLELDWLSGHVSREGARLGVPTPLNDLFLAALRRFDRKRGA